MVASEHYHEAERLLDRARSEMGESFADDLVIAAQAHATLALTSAAHVLAAELSLFRQLRFGPS